MSTLSQPPLIEAIFELRWGRVGRDPQTGETSFEFSNDDTDFLPGQFRSLAQGQGFSNVEPVNPGIPKPGLPHFVSYRFRKVPDTWPCYQIGLGIFTTNQVNEGYEWASFKKDIIAGLELLDNAHPRSLGGLPSVGVELRYQDGFILEKGETSLDFLKKKMEIEFAVPQAFLDSPDLERDLHGNKIQFHLGVNRPKGILLISLDQAIINGKPGFAMSTSVRSADGAQPEFTIGEMDKWLDEAHGVQRHAFKTLISQTYARRFK